MKISHSDINNLKMLKSVMMSGKFELKGDAIVMVASLVGWIDELEAKLLESMKPKIKKKTGIKEIK